MDRVQTTFQHQETGLQQQGTGEAAVQTSTDHSIRKQVLARILSDSKNDKEDYILNYTAGRGGE